MQCISFPLCIRCCPRPEGNHICPSHTTEARPPTLQDDQKEFKLIALRAASTYSKLKQTSPILCVYTCMYVSIYMRKDVNCIHTAACTMFRLIYYAVVLYISSEKCMTHTPQTYNTWPIQLVSCFEDPFPASPRPITHEATVSHASFEIVLCFHLSRKAPLKTDSQVLKSIFFSIVLRSERRTHRPFGLEDNVMNSFN